MDIMNLVTGFATPMVAGRIASALGVPEDAVRKVIGVAVPVVLGAILKRSSGPGGTDELGAALGRMESKPLDSLGNRFGGDASEVAATGTAGSDLLSSLLGPGAAATLASKLGGYAGIDDHAAVPLMGVAGTMALGGLKQTADDQGLDAAGVARLLESQRNEIAAAVPADFARSLEGTDILGPDLLRKAESVPAGAADAAAPAAAAPRTAPPPPRTPPPPPERQGGATRWIVGLIVLALLAWLLFRWLGGPEEVPVVEEEAVIEEEAVVEEPTAEPPAAEEAAEPAVEVPATEEAAEPVVEEPATEEATEPPAEEPATDEAAEPPADEPATEEAAEPAAEPLAPEAAAEPGSLVVDGVDVGASLQGVLGQVSEALIGVVDETSAQAAVPTLTGADDALEQVEVAAAALSEEGTTAIQAMVVDAMPTIQGTADALLADDRLAPILQPVLEPILAKLNALAG